MPAEIVKRKAKKKNESFFEKNFGIKTAKKGGFFNQLVKDFGEIASQAPAGIYNLADAYKKSATGDHKSLADIGRGSLKSNIEIAKHPLRNPGYTIVAAMGLAPVPGAAAARIVKKAPSGGVPRTRTLRYRPKNDEEAEFYRKGMEKIGRPMEGPDVEVDIPLSRVPTTAAVQKLVDRGRTRVPELQRKKIEKTLARQADILSRREALPEPGFLAALGALKEAGPRGIMHGFTHEPIKETNAALRAARLYRAAYVPPNWLGAQATNLIQQGPLGYARNIGAERSLRKNDPESAQMIDRLQGATISDAAMDVGGVGPLAVLSRGIGASLGKVTDRRARARAFIEEARKQGYDIDRIPELLKNDADLAQVVMRSEPAAIRFSRTPAFPGRNPSHLAKLDKMAGRNIFLYRWLTGSTRYSGRMLAEHPTLTHALATLGQQAPDITEVMPEVPDHMRNYIPSGMRDGFPLVRNPQAASLFDMPGETIKDVTNIARDWKSLGAPFQPVQATFLNSIAGYDPFREQRLSEVDEDMASALRFGAATQVRSIPWLEWLRINDSEAERERRLNPLTPMDIIGRQFLGSSLWASPVNEEVASRMKRQQEAKRRNKFSKKKRRRRTTPSRI